MRRHYNSSLFLLLGLLLSFPSWGLFWPVLPRYKMRFGWHPQVRRIILCENYERPTPGFLKLRDSSSLAHLVRLSKRRNLSRRLYATMALADQHYADLPATFGQLLRHDPPIRYSQFYSGTKHINYLHASEAVYTRLAYGEPAARSHQVPAFPTVADSVRYYTLLNRLDSVALRAASEGRHVHETLLVDCLENNAAYPGSYAYVRKLCEAADTVSYKSSPYAAALAAYHRPADIPLLLRFNRNAFKAVAAFPAPAFWPLLEKYRVIDNAYRSADYYRAVAALRTQAANRLLDSLITYTITSESDASNMANVLVESTVNYHASAVEQLWLVAHTTRLPLVRQQLQYNPQRAARAFAAGFLGFRSGEQGHYATSSYGHESDSVATVQLRAICRYDSAQFRAVARHIAQVCKWDEPAALYNLDQQYHFNWLRPTLLTELRAATEPLHRYVLVSWLLRYHDAATTAQARQAMAALPPCLPTTDVWCESLQRELARADKAAH